MVMAAFFCGTVAWICIILALVTGGCAVPPKLADQKITTWIVAPSGLARHSGGVQEAKSLVEAQGYRCYSDLDDLLWRDLLARYAACCVDETSLVQQARVLPLQQ